MNNILYDIFIAIVSGLSGAIFGAIIPRLIKDKNDTPQINIEKQLVFSKIQVDQKQYIVDSRESQRKSNKSNNRKQNLSGGEIIFCYLLIAAVLVKFFLKYERQINLFTLCTFIFLETTFITTAAITLKKYSIDKSIKHILLFNIVATICVPIILYFEQNPILGQMFNKKEILGKIETSGIFTLLFDSYTFAFLLYQIIGLVILMAFMTFTLFGLMHVLSMINLALKNRFSKMWSWIFRKTLVFCESFKLYMIIGISLLVLSVLFVSGILSTFITSL